MFKLIYKNIEYGVDAWVLFETLISFTSMSPAEASLCIQKFSGRRVIDSDDKLSIPMSGRASAEELKNASEQLGFVCEIDECSSLEFAFLMSRTFWACR